MVIKGIDRPVVMNPEILRTSMTVKVSQVDSVNEVVAVFLAAPAYRVRDIAGTAAVAVLTLTVRRRSGTRTVNRLEN